MGGFSFRKEFASSGSEFSLRAVPFGIKIDYFYIMWFALNVYNFQYAHA